MTVGVGSRGGWFSCLVAPSLTSFLRGFRIGCQVYPALCPLAEVEMGKWAHNSGLRSSLGYKERPGAGGGGGVRDSGSFKMTPKLLAQ